MDKNTIRENVIEILDSYEDARNSDKMLMFLYWKKYDNVVDEEGNLSMNLFTSRITTSPESLVRIRRVIQSEGMFPPTNKKVKKRRKIRERDMKEALLFGEVV